MTRILLFAPGAHPPWTEGRKNIARDLGEELQRRGHDVELVSGVENAHGAWQIAATLVTFWLRLLSRRVDHVIQFPRGRFRGWRGFANAAVARVVSVSCRLCRVPLLTFLYSVDGMTLKQAMARFGSVAAVGTTYPGVHSIRLGRCLPQGTATTNAVVAGPIRILFLCGYQSSSQAQVESVLHERGLLRLFEACAEVDRDLTLTVAIPLLRNRAVRQKVIDLAAKLCPATAIRIDSEVSPFSAMSDHSMLVFPYVAEHEVFVPTSMLEAMLVGIPVVASDRQMYRQLTVGADGARCWLAAEDTPQGLATAIRACIDSFQEARDRANRAREMLEQDWSIEGAVDDLLYALSVGNTRVAAPRT